MFEATDTSTDYGVIPDEGTENNPKRINLELMMIKPKGALHISYTDDGITAELKNSIFRGIEFFLST